MPGNRRYIHPEVKWMILAMTNNPEMTASQISRSTGVSERTQRRIRRLHARTGDVIQTPLVPGRARVLTSIDCAFLESCIERQADMTLAELQRALWGTRHIDVAVSTIWDTLRRRGFTRKMITRPAIERCELDRAEYQLLIGQYFEPWQLVFADESYLSRISARRAYGWAPTGNRARRRDFFIRGKRYSILPALSLDGILHLEVLKGSFTQATFDMFVQALLDRMNPWPLPNSVLVMDNASIHKSENLRAMIEDRGMRLLFLPAYSPDLNPIEEAFSSIKAWLQCHRDYVLGELTGAPGANPYAMIWEAVFTVTPEKAAGWFKSSGYIADEYD